MTTMKRQYTKDPKKKHGGYRVGGGRPFVDKKVEYTSVSYPKEFDPILRPIVKAKLKELKAARKPAKINKKPFGMSKNRGKSFG